MSCWKLVCLLLAVSSTVVGATQKTLALYHAVNGRDFVKRGTVVLEATKEEGLKMQVKNDATLDAAAVGSMLDTGLYQLQVVDEKNGQTVMTSVPACQLRRANFRDEITLTLGPKASLLSVTYAPLVSPLAPSCEELAAIEEAKAFESKISYETSTPGMTIPLVLPQVKAPPGIRFFRKNKGDPNSPPGVAEEETANPQNFIKKYWYILLPLAIIGLTGQGEPPQQEQQQGGGTQQQQQQQQPQASVASAAPVTHSPGAGGATRRRGKRG